ncbi:MAG: TRAM domain-containing protein [Halodesulfurarchaeum sp.]
MAASSDRAPVDEGDSYHLEIEELGREGDGIGYVEDFVVIVPDATLGESVPVVVDRVEEHYAVAEQTGEAGG